MNELSNFINQELTNLGFQPKDLMRRSSLSQPTVSRLINGVGKPDSDTLNELSKALVVDVAVLRELAYSDKVLPFPAYELSENIRKELAIRGWKYTELADRSGVPAPTINRFLNRRHQRMNDETVKKLAKGFGLTEQQLRFGQTYASNFEKLTPSNQRIVNTLVTALLSEQELNP